MPRPSSDASVVDSFEHLEIAVGEHVFDARTAGPEDGELVLLLHGFPRTSYQWRSQLRALADGGYRAVAPDQRGYSSGARPEGTQAYAVTNLFSDVVGIADALGYDTFHLVGHDWGGGIAWSVAGVLPERVATLTVLSTPHPEAMNMALQDERSCQYEASSYFDILTQSDVSPEVLSEPPFADEFGALSEETRAEYERMVLSEPAAFEAAVNWYRANIDDRMFTAASVGEIDVPTLYLWGSNDPFFCREPAEASAEQVHGSYRFVELEGAGHWLSDLVPDAVNRALLPHLETK